MKPYSNSTKISHIVTVQSKTGQKDDLGNWIWADFLTTYAQVSDRVGSEMFMDAENKIISTAKTTFTFRATEQVKQITPNMRIVWRGFVHIILSPVIFSDDRAFVSIETRREY